MLADAIEILLHDTFRIFQFNYDYKLVSSFIFVFIYDFNNDY